MNIVVNETPVYDSCTASGTYTYNFHTYSVPQTDHGQTSINLASSNVTENHGTFQYTLASIECNDGTFMTPTENETPTLQSCDSGYGESGGSCIQHACVTQPSYTHASYVE